MRFFALYGLECVGSSLQFKLPNKQEDHYARELARRGAVAWWNSLPSESRSVVIESMDRHCGTTCAYSGKRCRDKRGLRETRDDFGKT